MLLRITSFCPWLVPAALIAVLLAPVGAQPPSPLELVRGLRENGQVDLALEYLKDLQGKPLSADDKAALLLERAKCLLAASEDEPDEATRTGMVSQAKEDLKEFLVKFPNHPRSVEGRLTDAKLLSLDAREQLNRARRMDIPPLGETQEEKDAREAALQKQRTEAKKAEPMFLLAAKRFAESSALLRTKLDDKTLDIFTRRALQREAFEAELAGGINQFNTAETYMPASLISGAEKTRRNKLLEEAKATFTKLGQGPPTNRTVWIARAWAAEVTFEQDRFGDAAEEVNELLRARVLEAEDGKRLARFFQLRRNFLAALAEGNLQKALASEREIDNWLRSYGNPRKPTSEVFAVRYYHARVLQSLAETSIGPPPKDPKKPVTISATARKQLEEAEKLYRGLSQTDHDYTARATRQRMNVVRRLLGDADQPPGAYESFEKAQMASLIQLSKLGQAEALPDKTPEQQDKKAAEIKNRQLKTIALLERARDLASPQDSPADVTDVLLRLIYFYQITDQPYHAAVLGEHGAHTIKSTGGKAALAGLIGVNGYVSASTKVKVGDDPEAARAARKADRARAAALARFLDEKYPNDNPTDAARHRLAAMLTEDQEFLEAFNVLLRVRTAYAQINSARLLEGYLAQQIITAKLDPGQTPVPDAKKAEVFRRAVEDLAKVSKPAAVALEEDVRNYVSARCRLASLLFIQDRVDAKADAANPGHNQALAMAEELIALIPTFSNMVKSGGGKTLNLDGQEMTLLAQDVQARAVYLRARALIDAAEDAPPDQQKVKLDEAAKTLQPLIDAVEKNGPLFNEEMKKWALGTEGDDAVQKSRVAQLAGVVDRTRVEVILTGFRLKVKQGQAAEAKKLLELMVRAGGTVENSLPLLEPVGRELAARMVNLRKQGRKAEADALAAGLAALLEKIATVKNLPQPTILFVGQMLTEVGKPAEAMAMLKNIPPPEFAGWETKKADEIPKELRGRVQAQIRDYAIAQLGIARAMRESKKFDEAEKLLKPIIDGWGSGRLYFRKELAALYEDKGASIADVKLANPEWARGLKEWTTIFNIHRARLQKPPPGADMVELKNAFADAFFDVNRCLVKANQQLLKAQPPAKLQATHNDVAKRFADIEKQIPQAEWDPEVQHRYADFLKEVPALVEPYKAAGGKLFLEKLPVVPK